MDYSHSHSFIVSKMELTIYLLTQHLLEIGDPRSTKFSHHSTQGNAPGVFFLGQRDEETPDLIEAKAVPL